MTLQQRLLCQQVRFYCYHFQHSNAHLQTTPSICRASDGVRPLRQHDTWIEQRVRSLFTWTTAHSECASQGATWPATRAQAVRVWHAIQGRSHCKARQLRWQNTRQYARLSCSRLRLLSVCPAAGDRPVWTTLRKLNDKDTKWGSRVCMANAANAKVNAVRNAVRKRSEQRRDTEAM